MERREAQGLGQSLKRQKVDEDFVVGEEREAQGKVANLGQDIKDYLTVISPLVDVVALKAGSYAVLSGFRTQSFVTFVREALPHHVKKTQEQAGLTAVFSVKQASGCHSHALISSEHSTIVLDVELDQLLSDGQFLTHQPTLHCEGLLNQCVLQITPSHLALLDARNQLLNQAAAPAGLFLGAVYLRKEDLLFCLYKAEKQTRLFSFDGSTLTPKANVDVNKPTAIARSLQDAKEFLAVAKQDGSISFFELNPATHKMVEALTLQGVAQQLPLVSEVAPQKGAEFKSITDLTA